jgi:SPP1 family predicted phage head-tail adaptor
MRAGRLKHTVILQQPAGSQDSVGERTTTWGDTVTVHAAIEPLRASEVFAGRQQQGSSTHRIQIRYSAAVAGIDNSWRVKYGTRIFTIDGPPRNIQERNRTLELICTEGNREE